MINWQWQLQQLIKQAYVNTHAHTYKHAQFHILQQQTINGPHKCLRAVHVSTDCTHPCNGLADSVSKVLLNSESRSCVHTYIHVWMQQQMEQQMSNWGHQCISTHVPLVYAHHIYAASVFSGFAYSCTPYQPTPLLCNY